MPVEYEPVRQSLLSWVFSALGIYALLLPLVALMAFVLVLIVVLRGRGAMAGAALVLIVPLPMLVGVFAALQGLISSFTVVATSVTAPRPDQLALGYSLSLAAPMVGMLLTIPGYVVATLGVLIRALQADASNAAPRADRPEAARKVT